MTANPSSIPKQFVIPTEAKRSGGICGFLSSAGGPGLGEPFQTS